MPSFRAAGLSVLVCGVREHSEHIHASFAVAVFCRSRKHSQLAARTLLLWDLLHPNPDPAIMTAGCAGFLTLSGTATIAAYQTALLSVTYGAPATLVYADVPNMHTRDIAFSVENTDTVSLEGIPNISQQNVFYSLGYNI